METSLAANGVISISREAIVACDCEEDGDLAKRTRHKKDGAARNSRRGPFFKDRNSCFVIGVVGLALERLRADNLGVSPPSAGSFANG
jgi:hypothetical protein